MRTLILLKPICILQLFQAVLYLYMMTLSRIVTFNPSTAATVIIWNRTLSKSSVLSSGHHAEQWWGPEINNGREVVGYGSHGEEVCIQFYSAIKSILFWYNFLKNYSDRIDFWFPAIRFRKNDDAIIPIREKELGDWKNLTNNEKKLLYRYSFRQTLAEFDAPRGY